MQPIERVVARHRAQINAREAAAFEEMVTAYNVIEEELRVEIRRLQRKIEKARREGEEISERWLGRERRLATLIDQVKLQIERFGGTATAVTRREQLAAIRLAAEHDAEIFQVLTGSDSRALGALLPTRAVEDAVGFLGDGTPILEYYREQLAPKVAEAIRIEVIKAVAKGTDFRVMANRLVKTGQITRNRALAVARTETNRVRRESTRQRFVEAGVTEWEWVTTKDRRVCAACIALDGRRFPVNEFFPQHINDRCTLIPVIDGIDPPARTKARDWFARQPDAIKQEILGKQAAAALAAGDVTLDDFLGINNDPRFGKSVFTRPLGAIITGGRNR